MRKPEDHLKVVKRDPEYARFEIVGTDSQGFLLFSCDWYTSSGICKDHEKRLDICRSYPDTSLYFSGGEMITNCGYSFKEMVPFEKVLQEEIDSSDEKKKSITHN